MRPHRHETIIDSMRFKHTDRPGFWFGLIDFCTAGLFFLFYMPLDGLQEELDYILSLRSSRRQVLQAVSNQSSG